MGTALCKHELPEHLCDICTPRQPRRPRSGSMVVSTPPRVEDPDTVVVAANFAYGVYLRFEAYACQPDRAFRQDIQWMGFYADEVIQPEIARILDIRDRVSFTPAEVERLRQTGDPMDRRVSEVIESLAKDPRWGEREYKVFLLSGPQDPQTLRLAKGIVNNLVGKRGSGTAFTQSQRYTRLEFLQQDPNSTTDLINLSSEVGTG